VFTAIQSYTNKKGDTYPVHFTYWGKFYGKVSSLGEEPVSYMGWFPVKKEFFYFDAAKIGDNELDIGSFMLPITLK
jgi:hypothetical protein